jgi:hypothetical protein
MQVKSFQLAERYRGLKGFGQVMQVKNFQLVERYCGLKGFG